MLCGVVRVAFTCLVTWFTKSFEYVKERFGLPAVECPALGGWGAGIIALKYPGTLYWGFTNVEEILHTGKSAAAPGIWLLTQLSAAKVVATALCKESACWWSLCPKLDGWCCCWCCIWWFCCRNHKFSYPRQCRCCPATSLCTGKFCHCRLLNLIHAQICLVCSLRFIRCLNYIFSPDPCRSEWQLH